MKTALTVNTNERIFLVHYNFDMGRKDMANLKHLQQLVKNSNGVKKIDHFWNGKFKRISKKDLKSMLEVAQLETEFLNLI